MAKGDFDRELSIYLSRRKKAGMPDIVRFLKGFLPKPTPPPVKMSLPEDIETYEEKPVVPAQMQQPKPALQKQEKKEEIMEEVQEYKADQKNVLGFIMDKIGIARKQAMTEEEKEAKIQDLVKKEMMQKDIREVAKIALMAIKKLQPDDLKQFKNSAEFDALKGLLKKYDLIK